MPGPGVGGGGEVHWPAPTGFSSLLPCVRVCGLCPRIGISIHGWLNVSTKWEKGGVQKLAQEKCVQVTGNMTNHHISMGKLHVFI